jgi:hypothetical protein
VLQDFQVFGGLPTSRKTWRRRAPGDGTGPTECGRRLQASRRGCSPHDLYFRRCRDAPVKQD